MAEREPTAKRMRDEQPLIQKVCKGEASFWLNCLCGPFVLIANAYWIYMAPCFGILLGRLYYLICCCCGVYTDKTFDGAAIIGQEFEWVRASELAEEGKKMKVYDKGITPNDLAQGAVGDCWLVAALSSAAEHPTIIRRAFLTPEYNPRGKYRVRIYDGQNKKWVTVTIDDRIPCKKGTKKPLFMKHHGNELWAMLVEKAFAKFCGGYPKLDGGLSVWAWKALTGDPTFELEMKNGKWTRDDFVHKQDPADKRAGGFMGRGESYTMDQTWVLIQKYIRANALLAASGVQDVGGNSEGLNGETVDHKGGLVAGHAYSILDARELGLIPGLGAGGLLGKTKLIRLRNPWGTFEWKGAWADGSKEWKENPIVRMRLRPKDEDDGSFWMPWDEFSRIYTRVQVCDRSTGRDLKLDVKEDFGACGVVVGCCAGCTEFCVCCKGLRVIYGGHRSDGKTRSAKRGCCGLVGCCEGSKARGAPEDLEMQR